MSSSCASQHDIAAKASEHDNIHVNFTLDMPPSYDDAAGEEMPFMRPAVNDEQRNAVVQAVSHCAIRACYPGSRTDLVVS